MGVLACSSGQEQSVQIQSEADLSGHRVAITAGTCYDIDLSQRKDLELHRFNNNADALQSLLNGVADILVEDETVFNSQIRKEYGIKIAFKGTQSFPTAFMFQKEDAALAQACTATQNRMIEDGSMARLKAYWVDEKYAREDHFTHIPEETEGTPIRVATATATAPISFLVESDWYGLEMDILRELSRDLHRPLDVKYYDPASAILALKSGLVDIVSGGVFITPEREQEFRFSEPYHAFHSAFFVVDTEASRDSGGVLQALKKSIRRNLLTEKRWIYIVEGLWETLKISFLAILLGSILGVGLYAMARSRRKWVRSAASLYNGFIAGIPELVLLLILFYVVFARSGVPPDLVAVVSFALCFASGASDIYATSLDAIPYGQTEGGLALGFTRRQTFFYIIFPQALRRGLPLYKSQCVSILKGTSIVGYIAIQDLTRAGDIIRSRTFDALVPLLLVTIIYFLLVWLIGLLLKLAMPSKKAL